MKTSTLAPTLVSPLVILAACRASGPSPRDQTGAVSPANSGTYASSGSPPVATTGAATGTSAASQRPSNGSPTASIAPSSPSASAGASEASVPARSLRSCSEIGCISGLQINVFLKPGMASLHLCIATECVEIQFDTVQVGDPMGRSFPSSVDVQSSKLVAEARRTTADRVEIAFASRAGFGLRDHDTCTIRFKNRAGRAGPEKVIQIPWERWYPNGKECDGDYYCVSATLEL